MKYILLTIMGLLPILVLAAEDQAPKYDRCMLLAADNPAQAVSMADEWILQGTGGVPAGHCKALALLGMGQPEAAAKLLEKLLQDMAGRPGLQLKIELYGQAAISWKMAGNLDNAYLAFSAALAALPDMGDKWRNSRYELYLARGTLQILRRKHKAAVADLSQAIRQDDQKFEGFLQRAKAHRKRRHYLKARMDLRLAQKLNRDSPDIVLESGILFREKGDKSAAHEAWQKLIDLYPTSDLAAAAQENIDLLGRE